MRKKVVGGLVGVDEVGVTAFGEGTEGVEELEARRVLEVAEDERKQETRDVSFKPRMEISSQEVGRLTEGPYAGLDRRSCRRRWCSSSPKPSRPTPPRRTYS